MGYSNPDRRTYMFPLFDFGGGSDQSFKVIGPKGKAGRLIDYGVQDVQEAMNGDTLDPKIAVGTSSDPDAYGDEFTLSNADNVPSSVRSTYDPGADKTSFETYVLNDGIIPADTVVYLTCSASTGANLTGQGMPFMVIDWDS